MHGMKRWVLPLIFLGALFLSACTGKGLPRETQPGPLDAPALREDEGGSGVAAGEYGDAGGQGGESKSYDADENDGGAASYVYEHQTYSLSSLEDVMYTDRYGVMFSTFALSRLGEEYEQHYTAELHYPVITGLPERSEGNALLEQAAYGSIAGDTLEEKQAALLGEFRDPAAFRELYVAGKVLYLDEKHASVLYYTMAYAGGNRPVTSHHMVTVDLESNEYVAIEELISKERVLQAIGEKEYEIYEGADFTISKDPHGDSLAQEFAEAFAQQADEGHDRARYNVGLDRDHAYVYFSCKAGLHGYIILRIPLDSGL